MGHGSTHRLRSPAPLLSLELRRSAHPQCRGQKNVTRPPTFSDDYTGTCSSTTWTSLVVMFNMSAFSTVFDVVSDLEFSAPGNSFLWGLGALDEPNRECTGFLVMPKRPYDWRVDSHGCYKYDNASLGSGPRDQTAHLPAFLHLRTTNLPGPDSIMRSEHAQQRRFERRHHRHERMKRRRT